ncbi:hypothetical protein Tco_0085902 [Tanacetum coccineum]
MAKEEGIEVVEEASIEDGVEEVLVLVPELAKEKRITGEVSLDGWVGAGGGEVNGGGVVLGVSKQFSFELVFIGDSGGEIIGEVGGAPDV